MVGKCKVLSFGRSAVNAYDYQYLLSNVALEEVNFHKDLGVISLKARSSDFNRQVNAVISQAFRALGFIIRAIKEFRNVNTFVYLYKTSVLPILLFKSNKIAI